MSVFGELHQMTCWPQHTFMRVCWCPLYDNIKLINLKKKITFITEELHSVYWMYKLRVFNVLLSKWTDRTWLCGLSKAQLLSEVISSEKETWERKQEQNAGLWCCVSCQSARRLGHRLTVKPRWFARLLQSEVHAVFLQHLLLHFSWRAQGVSWSYKIKSLQRQL